VDVPAISNIVFLRSVRSRILYEQMKGRATRLCPEIEKDVFSFFDAVGLHKVLEKVDTMKPIVQKVNVTIEQLVDELNEEASYQTSGDALGLDSDKTHAEDVKEQLIVKLQSMVRRTQNLEKYPDAKEPLLMLESVLKRDEKKSFEELPSTLKEMNAREVGTMFQKLNTLVPLLNDLREGLNINKSDMVISTHDDEMLSVSRGYGKDSQGNLITAPEDYLESFETFIKENVNKMMALKSVVERPRDLTREDLKALNLKLAEEHFNEKTLHSAWKESKNEDIAATIIGYIRSLALGTELIPFEQRVDNALKKVKSSQSWSKNQERWLDRLAKQLKANVILDDESLNASPFKEKGGKEMLDKQLDNRLDEILDDLSDYMWA
jgi:type I restriction enzyme R subunit